MHHLYSSIISRKFIIIFLNESIHYVYIKSDNVFLQFFRIIVPEQEVF